MHCIVIFIIVKMYNYRYMKKKIIDLRCNPKFLLQNILKGFVPTPTNLYKSYKLLQLIQRLLWKYFLNMCKYVLSLLIRFRL